MVDATSSTTSTATPTPTVSGADIVKTIGTGSGVDTTALVAGLVQAQFALKNQQLKAKEDALTAQISAVATVQSNITDFASALDALVKGGSLASSPTSSNSAVLSATALSGAKLANLSATVEVTQIATAQSATTKTSFASRSTVVGTGTLTFTLGTATVDANSGTMTAFTAGTAQAINVTIDSTNNTLDGIAKAINAAKTGVTATVVTDVDGTARLSLKGATGTASAFTVSGDSPELQQLNVGPGQGAATSIGSAAGNAKLKLDGVAVERASNTVSDLIDGVKLQLNSASIGNPVTLGGSTPTAALSAAVNNFVATFNETQSTLKTNLDPINGPLKNDVAAATLSRSLRNLTTTPLVASSGTGAPTTLADIGVATARDGSLSVNAAQLAAALAKYPDAVEAMFAASTSTNPTSNGLNAAFASISKAATSSLYGLAASKATYTKAKTTVTDAEAKAADDATTMKTRLTQQFAAMDSKVAAYKSTQTFLTAQIAAWNKTS
ncbi:flagellar filament capping protein FliD [Sphingomonas immobilis]|uniref:Flagellar hook-associated protein 2 n=1 Tax=Sphingomonas immobilis TaxID=3063997 RepID=A0ABT8ZW22_9SPHN|nr:flagellar filament capping protein FliD [Sphingomonas sp. CA1-15]MDO7841473.1 flagellar filament capping protein FliD [Sphingomonas sp. CA1-15]